MTILGPIDKSKNENYSVDSDFQGSQTVLMRKLSINETPNELPEDKGERLESKPSEKNDDTEEIFFPLFAECGSPLSSETDVVLSSADGNEIKIGKIYNNNREIDLSGQNYKKNMRLKKNRETK